MRHTRHLGICTGVVALIVVILLVVAGVAGSAASAILEAVGVRESGSDRVDPAIFHAPTPDLPVASEPEPVAAVATGEPGTSADAVTSRIRQVGPAPGTVYGQVLDVASGEALYSADSDGVGVPASTMKVLTALGVLDVYGPDHRFSTETRADASDPTHVWIVGGGDPTLTGASLDTLADRTADALTESGTTRVTLGVDASIFAGDGWNPTWRDVYRDYVTPTEGLWLDRGRLSDNAVGPREQHPVDATGRAFADALRARGIDVGGVERSAAPDEDAATPLGAVASAPLSSIVERALAASDNDTMEILFRHIGRDGGDGSLDASRTRLRDLLTERKIWADGMQIADGSGLSRGNRVAASALAEAVALAASEEEPDLRPVLLGMPVAGAEGTLLERFVEPGTEAGRGVVRGKTGTLTGVSSLAGYMRDKDGAILVFAFIVNGAPEADYGARVYLDRVTSALADCGCS